jgi:hypothetical protein
VEVLDMVPLLALAAATLVPVALEVIDPVALPELAESVGLAETELLDESV